MGIWAHRVCFERDRRLGAWLHRGGEVVICCLKAIILYDVRRVFGYADMADFLRWRLSCSQFRRPATIALGGTNLRTRRRVSRLGCILLRGAWPSCARRCLYCFHARCA